MGKFKSADTDSCPPTFCACLLIVRSVVVLVAAIVSLYWEGFLISWFSSSVRAVTSRFAATSCQNWTRDLPFAVLFVILCNSCRETSWKRSWKQSWKPSSSCVTSGDNRSSSWLYRNDAVTQTKNHYKPHNDLNMNKQREETKRFSIECGSLCLSSQLVGAIQ